MFTTDPLKLGHLYDFAFDYRPTSNDLKIKAIDFINKNFESNVIRLQSAMLVPAYSGHFARYLERCLTIAQFELEGTATAELEIKSELFLAIFERAKEIMRENDLKIRSQQKTENEWREWTRGKIEIGAAPSTMMSAKMKNSFHAALASYVTNGWTIFETMAADLWEAALNAHPRTLSSLSGSKTEFYRKDPAIEKGTKDNQQPPNQRIRLETLARYNFDLRDKMGTALRDDQRSDSLMGIRESYARAFSYKFKDIKNAIMDFSLDRLSTIRNLIVHRNGVADASYLKAIKIIPGLPQLDERKPIELDGENVTALLANAFNASQKLIYVVHAWLDDN